MIDDGFEDAEQREFFGMLSDIFKDRSIIAYQQGFRGDYEITEQVNYRGYHEITLTRRAIFNIGGHGKRDESFLAMQLRKMVIGI